MSELPGDRRTGKGQFCVIKCITPLFRRKLGYVALFRLIRASRRLNHTSNCDQACEQSQLGRNCRLQLLVAAADRRRRAEGVGSFGRYSFHGIFAWRGGHLWRAEAAEGTASSVRSACREGWHGASRGDRRGVARCQRRGVGAAWILR